MTLQKTVVDNAGTIPNVLVLDILAPVSVVILQAQSECVLVAPQVVAQSEPAKITNAYNVQLTLNVQAQHRIVLYNSKEISAKHAPIIPTVLLQQALPLAPRALTHA